MIKATHLRHIDDVLESNLTEVPFCLVSRGPLSWISSYILLCPLLARGLYEGHS